MFTASDGSWQLAGLKPGTYQLLFEHSRFVPQAQKVSVRAGGVTNVGTRKLEPR